MITNDNQNYDQYESNLPQDNQSYGDENNLEKELYLSEDQNYLDNEFSNALERDDQDDLEQDLDDDTLEEDDLDEEDDLEDSDDDLDEDDLDDDLTEDYDENDREPETFSDDAYKID